MDQKVNSYLELIFDCVESINSDLPDAQKLSADKHSVLIGNGGVYDSLSIINLLVAVEEALNNLGEEVLLLDEDLVTDNDGPYSTLYKLADFIANSKL